jgi:hypothetical protein
MRWGVLSQAQAFAADAQAVADYQANPEIRITRYEVVQGPSMLDPHHAVQSVAIGYVFESSQRVNELIDQQVWQYDAEGKRWLRQSPIPEFR